MLSHFLNRVGEVMLHDLPLAGEAVTTQSAPDQGV